MELVILLIVVAVGVVALRKVLGGSTPADRVKVGAPRPDLSVDDLRLVLQRGGTPSPVAVPFRLEPGEECYGVVDASVEQWLEGDGSYMTKHVAWSSGIPALAVGSALNAVGNARRKAAAAREAAERWRSIGQHRIYVTSERIAFSAGREWHEMWHEHIRRVERDAGSIVVQVAGGTATRLHVVPTGYWYTLLRWLVMDERPGAELS